MNNRRYRWVAVEYQDGRTSYGLFAWTRWGAGRQLSRLQRFRRRMPGGSESTMYSYDVMPVKDCPATFDKPYIPSSGIGGGGIGSGPPF
jgi:hypothetical protein